MSKVINLFSPKADSTFTIDAVDRDRVLANELPEADIYLQELKVGGSIRCCVFKDIGGVGTIPDGPLASFRQAMLTLPQGIGYVNYILDRLLPDPVIIVNGSEQAKLPAMLTTLLLYDIIFSWDTDTKPLPFHYCDDNDESNFEIPPVACAGDTPAFRQSQERPFHLFWADDFVLRTKYYGKEVIKGHIYLVPFAISEGVIVFFIIDGDENQRMATLQTLANEIIKVQKNTDGKHHWLITSELIYQDMYGIFTCTCVTSKINGVFGKPIGKNCTPIPI